MFHPKLAGLTAAVAMVAVTVATWGLGGSFRLSWLPASAGAGLLAPLFIALAVFIERRLWTRELDAALVRWTREYQLDEYRLN